MLSLSRTKTIIKTKTSSRTCRIKTNKLSNPLAEEVVDSILVSLCRSRTSSPAWQVWPAPTHSHRKILRAKVNRPLPSSSNPTSRNSSQTQCSHKETSKIQTSNTCNNKITSNSQITRLSKHTRQEEAKLLELASNSQVNSNMVDSKRCNSQVAMAASSSTVAVWAIPQVDSTLWVSSSNSSLLIINSASAEERAQARLTSNQRPQIRVRLTSAWAAASNSSSRRHSQTRALRLTCSEDDGNTSSSADDR